MAKVSAGLLLYRRRGASLQVLLVHPGGPFWKGKDEGAWSIPKGEVTEGEDLLSCARREFQEETGFALDGEFQPLAPVRQAGGKQVFAWAIAGDIDEAAARSNRFSLEWPPRSGRIQDYPEVDRAAWLDLATARRKINPGQRPLIDALERLVG
jgi:predicted NUDIX family NTP pyrophosphohydrolase